MSAKPTEDDAPQDGEGDGSFSEDFATTPPPKSIETVKAASDAVSHLGQETRDVRIRERAYRLWEEAGRPDGRHEQFWHQAEAEFDGM